MVNGGEDIAPIASPSATPLITLPSILYYNAFNLVVSYCLHITHTSIV